MRLRAAHLANMRTLAAHRKQRIADLQARFSDYTLSAMHIFAIMSINCRLACLHANALGRIAAGYW